MHFVEMKKGGFELPTELPIPLKTSVNSPKTTLVTSEEDVVTPEKQVSAFGRSSTLETSGEDRPPAKVDSFHSLPPKVVDQTTLETSEEDADQKLSESHQIML